MAPPGPPSSSPSPRTAAAAPPRPSPAPAHPRGQSAPAGGSRRAAGRSGRGGSARPARRARSAAPAGTAGRGQGNNNNSSSSGAHRRTRTAAGPGAPTLPTSLPQRGTAAARRQQSPGRAVPSAATNGAGLPRVSAPRLGCPAVASAPSPGVPGPPWGTALLALPAGSAPRRPALPAGRAPRRPALPAARAPRRPALPAGSAPCRPALTAGSAPCRAAPRGSRRRRDRSRSVGLGVWARSGAVRSGAVQRARASPPPVALPAPLKTKGLAGHVTSEPLHMMSPAPRGPGSCSSAAPPEDGPAAGRPSAPREEPGTNGGDGRASAAMAMGGSSCRRYELLPSPSLCRGRGSTPHVPHKYTRPTPSREQAKASGASKQALASGGHLPAGQSLVPALGSPTEALQQENNTLSWRYSQEVHPAVCSWQ
ncbi:translation initiation factor IF-2-like [Vidua macroura]|uniref:translation initiation factor IF-2-like n=1 Tax=Vidua macroura TaxID=187451 RepID=UPI0023A7AC5E|nr:translation initiation factor IF-2-like [Vidua macroura]